MRSRTSLLTHAIGRVVAQPLDHEALRLEADRALRRHLGYDVSVWATVDPATMIWTHCMLSGFARDHALEAAVFRNEYGSRDVLKVADLARAESPAGALALVTGGRPESSPRHAEIFAPMGLRDELRLVLLDGTACWGCAVLFRASDRFTAEEVADVARVSRTLGTGLRLAVLRSAVDGMVQPEAPGLLLVGPGGSVEATTAEAERLVGDAAGGVSAAFHAVAARTAAGVPARATVPAPGGGWLVLSGTRLGERVAVIVERARPFQLAEVIVRAYGLTPRERDVVGCVARGLDTKETAAELAISPWTVQDHLKSSFAKVGVDSRQALVAAIFFGHYAPRHDAGARPSPGGFYVDPA